MIAAFVIAAVLSQAPAYYTPEEAKQIFLQGAAAYENGQYDDALAQWQKLVDHGLGTSDVLYNMGTAELQKGDLGKAVLYLERARKLGPASDDLQAQLDVARQRQGDQVVGAESGETFVERVARATPKNLVAEAFLATWVGGALLVLLYRLLRPGKRTLVGVLAGLLLVAALPLGALFAAHVYVERTVHEGVVQPATLQARDLPTPASRVAFEVHAGLKVRLLESEGRFVRIRLPNGLVGWTEKEGIAQL